MIEASQHFLPFCQFLNPLFVVSRHHEIIAEHLEAVERGDIRHLMVFMPPRSSKSFMISEYFPAWYLGKHPNQQVLSISYKTDLAEGWGRKVRDTVLSEDFRGIFPDCRISPGHRAMGSWGLTKGGVYNIGAIVGGVAGKGAHLGIIDDPLNEQDAYSQAARDHAIRWWPAGFTSRVMPDGRIIILMCLTGDTDVLMGNGTIKKLNSIRPGDLISTYEDGKRTSKPVEFFVPQGPKEIFKLVTPNHSVKGSGNHPFLVKREKLEYVRLDQIKPGDLIVSSFCNSLGDEPITLEQAWLLGFMFGDGWVTEHPNKQGAMRWATCWAYGIDEEQNEKVLKLFEQEFGKAPKKTKFGYYRFEIAAAGRWFKEHGLVGTAKTKRVPDFIFTSSLRIRQEFLTGFVAADGHKDKKKQTTIRLANKELIGDLRNLAYSLGIRPSNVHMQTRTYQPPHSPKPIIATNWAFSFGARREVAEFGFARVRSVEPCGIEEVFDLTVADNHNFIANGLVCHNTRWHEEDLAGHVLRESENNPNQHQWTTLKIPALLDEQAATMLGYTPGTSYWPVPEDAPKEAQLKGWPTDELLKRKAGMPEYQWASVYQQDPKVEGGTIIKEDWWKIWDKADPPFLDYIIISCDTAFSTASTADFSVIQTWGVFRHKDTEDESASNKMICLAVKKGRWEYPELVQRVVKQCKKYKPDVILVEKQSSGQSLIQDLLKTGWPVAPYNPDRDKIARAHSCTRLFKAGKLWLPKATEKMTWVKEFVHDCSIFPAGKHDDTVDAATQAIIWAREQFLIQSDEDLGVDTFDEEAPRFRRHGKHY